MARVTQLLLNAIATGAGPVAQPSDDTLSVQAWIDTGTATVVVQASNDDRAAGLTPDAAAWDDIATISLSGANDQEAMRDVVPFRFLRANVTAVSGGAKVNAAMGV